MWPRVFRIGYVIYFASWAAALVFYMLDFDATAYEMRSGTTAWYCMSIATRITGPLGILLIAIGAVGGVTSWAKRKASTYRARPVSAD